MRVVPRNPVALEKFDSIQQMGRFTLRDEGKTIGVGKILKYKPFKQGIVGASKSADSGATSKSAAAIVTNQAPAKELVFNMETGETAEKAKPMEAIAEGDEDNDE